MISRKATKLLQCENYGIKIRESNGLTKSKITNELTWRNIFLMRKNFSFFHLHIVEITEQNYTSTVFSQIFCQIDVLLKNDLYCKLIWQKNLRGSFSAKITWNHFILFNLQKGYTESWLDEIFLSLFIENYWFHEIFVRVHNIREFCDGLMDFNTFWFDVIMNSAQLSNKCKFKLLSLHLN